MTHVDPERRQAVCEICGPIRIGVRRLQSGRLSWRCSKSNRGAPDSPSRIRKFERLMRYVEQDRVARSLVTLDVCERCGLVPEDPADPIELDVHHKDGNRKNNSRDNLAVLCACCHRVVEREKREGTTMGEMRVLNRHGDERIDWNPDDAEDVKRAKGEFERLKGEGYEFYEVVDTKGRKISKFSAKAGKLIAAPGGRKEADKRSGARPRAMAGGPTARFASRA